MRQRFTVAPFRWGVSLVLALQIGCEEDRPYTPFQVASALPSAPPARPSSPPPGPAPKTAATFAAAKPIKQTPRNIWKIEGQTIKAAPKYQIQRALRADFDGNGHKEVVAWLVPESDPLERPELWLYPASGSAKKLFTLPGFVPTGPTCTLQTQLLQTGPQTVTLDTFGACEARLIARAPVRSIAVVAPLRAQPVVLALRAAKDGPEERFELAVSSQDFDGDTRDDVALSVSVRTQETAAATARFLWYDRQAGASRDDSEPGLSMARLASRELVRAKGKNTSKSVPAIVRNLRRLYGAVCTEAGTPRLFDAEGHGLSCGSLSTTFSRAKRAEIVALLKNDQLIEAVGVLVRDGWFGHPADAREQQQYRALVAAKVPERTARVKQWLEVTLPRRGTHPRYSPLDFQADGTLRVQTSARVLAFTSEGVRQELEEGAEPLSAWPLRVASPGQRLWTGVVHSCDRAEMTLSFVDRLGNPLASEPINTLAPRPGTCRAGKPVPYPHPVPIGWKGEKLLGWVGGERIGPVEPETRPPGSALSHNGRWAVFPTPLGLLVTGAKTELWSVPAAISPPERLTDCTIRNDGRVVACSRQGRAVLIQASD